MKYDQLPPEHQARITPDEFAKAGKHNRRNSVVTLAFMQSLYDAGGVGAVMECVEQGVHAFGMAFATAGIDGKLGAWAGSPEGVEAAADLKTLTHTLSAAKKVLKAHDQVIQGALKIASGHDIKTAKGHCAAAAKALIAGEPSYHLSLSNTPLTPAGVSDQAEAMLRKWGGQDGPVGDVIRSEGLAGAFNDGDPSDGIDDLGRFADDGGQYGGGFGLGGDLDPSDD